MADQPTLDSAAPAQAGQPAAPEAVAPAAQPAPQPTQPTQAQPATDAAAQPAQPVRLWAGKYQTPEELERGYANSTSEAMRLYQENLKLQEQTRQAQPAAAKPQTYTPEQLQMLKVQVLNELTEARVNGDVAKAQEKAGNLVWIDNQILDQRLQANSTQMRQQSALQELTNEGQTVLQQYQGELQPGKPLYTEAEKAYSRLIAAGYPANDVTTGMAVSYAVLKTGTAKAGVEQAARASFADNLNKNIKAAVATGAGQATAPTGTITAQQIQDMTPQQFAEYERAYGRA